VAAVVGIPLIAVAAAIYFSSSSERLARIPIVWLYATAAVCAALLIIGVLFGTGVIGRKPKEQKELEQEFDASVSEDRRLLLTRVEQRYRLAGDGDPPLVLTGIPDTEQLTKLGETQLAYVGSDAKARVSHAAIAFVYLRPEMVIVYEAIVDVTSGPHAIWEQVLDFPFRSIATVVRSAEAIPPAREAGAMGMRRLPPRLVQVDEGGASTPGRPRSREELAIVLVDGTRIRIVTRDRSIAADPAGREGALLAWADSLDEVWSRVRERWVAAQA
jgi:hypothetical protein